MRTALIMITICLALVGCAGDYQEYSQMQQTHSTEQAAQVSAQANAIAAMVSSARVQSPTEGALIAVIGAMMIKDLKFTPLNVEAPTTGMDVLNTTAGHLPLGLMGLANWSIAREGFRAAGDINTFQAEANVDGSFNKSYSTSVGNEANTTATASGTETTATAPGSGGFVPTDVPTETPVAAPDGITTETVTVTED